MQQNPDYTGPQLAREEQHNPAGADVCLIREENTYTVEAHQDATDYGVVNTGCVQQNRVHTHVHMTWEQQLQKIVYTDV